MGGAGVALGAHEPFEQWCSGSLRGLLDRLPIAAYACDPDGQIRYFNHRAAALWGREPALHHREDRFCGSLRLFHPDGTPVRHDACWTAIALRDNRAFEGREAVIERPDGSRVTVMVHVDPVRDASGRLLGALSLFVDVTERKRAEEALREAERSREAFVATLADELRNPLSPVGDALDYLREGASPEEAAWARRLILRQMRHLTHLADELFDVARIATIALRRERVDLGELIRAAVESSRPSLQRRGHRLSLELPEAPLALHGDAARLTRTLENLLHNAARYTPNGGHIELRAHRESEQAVVRVRDNGIGLPADALPRIFEPFVQLRAEGSSGGTRGGLGVGLTLARRVVELHGGRLEARSAGPDEGSEFAVHLPLDTAGATRLRARRRVAPEPAQRARRVLVVDANPDVAASLARLLALRGYDAHSAADGSAALKLAAGLRPDAVMLDVDLSGPDGYEVARRMRAESWGRDLLLVAFSAWGQDEDVRRSRQAGFDHHLVKPLSPRRLVELLCSLDDPE